MAEYDAFAGYPEPREPRIVSPTHRTIHNRIAASYRDREFYDGDRANGYGGMVNDGRWGPVAERIIDKYCGYGHMVLQIAAHKGFLAYELFKRGMRVWSCETSQYACENSMVRHDLIESFTKLPYEDKSFDVVICASAVYMQNLPGAIQVLKEIQRVTRKHAWVSLGAMEDENDVDGLMMLRWWFLNGTTILTKADWLEVMAHAGYTGDYRFDTAKYLNLVRG